jgi:mannan endo-1,4-beta-mannosidase
MKRLFAYALISGTLALISPSLCRGESGAEPVTTDASPEAKELLKFIYRISGHNTLSGQHNYPAERDEHTQTAYKAWGKMPAIFGKDWGFAKAGDKDSAFVRDQIVGELTEKYRNGSLCVLCWHEVPPTADEPVSFKPAKDSTNTEGLHSVQGHLTEAQYKELLTPGTELNQRWCAQVDALVPYFKKLEQARVPILWRPFHEMNGQWFWWGGRRGKYGSAALYKMMFERLAKHHQLKNLIWVWNVDRPEGTSLKFADCWPGPECVDVVSMDNYHEFKQSYYDDLLKLANGKPVALAEIGGNLSLPVLQAQPKWAWWMVWAGFGLHGDETNRMQAIVNAQQSWSLNEPEYRKAIAPLRQASGLSSEAQAH